MKVLEHKKSLISIIVFCIILVLNYMHFTKTLNYGTSTMVLFICTLALIGLLYLTLVFFKVKKIENKFLIIFSFFSLLYLMIIPYKYNPDEFAHFMRASEIATGQLVSRQNENGEIGRYDSVSLEEDTKFVGYKDYYTKLTKAQSEEQVFYEYGTAAIYPFVVYLPQSLGIAFANLLGGSALLMILFGKIFNLICFIFLAYMGLKYMPKYKTFCLAVLLFPMTIQLATSMAADATIIGLTFFFVALIMKIREDQKITTSQKIIIPAIALFVSLAKVAYLPVIFIILLLPIGVFTSKKNRNLYVGLTLLLVTIINVVWMKYAMSNFLSEGIRPEIDSAKQLEFVLHNFLLYISIFINTIIIKFDFYIHSMIQEDLVTNILKPRYYSYFMFYCMWITLIFTKDRFNTSKIVKGISLASFLACCGCIFTSLYMQWTAYQGPIIEGVQGRYFLPVLFLLPLMIFSLNFKKDFIKPNFILISFSLINILSIASYIVYYINLF